MIQVFENKIPQVGEFAFVRGKRNGRTIEGVFICVEDGCYLLNSDTYLRGCSPNDTSLISAFCQLWSWQLAVDNDDDDTILDIIGRTINNVTILTQRHTIKERKIDFVSNNYDKRNYYTGYHGYHSHRYDRLNKPKKSAPYLFGVEMEVEFNSDEDREDFTDKTSNWFYCERDGSLCDSGCEIITVPLLPSDAKKMSFWEPLTSYLEERANASARCGLHVHISRSILGEGDVFNYNLGKLLYAYHHHWAETWHNIKIAGRARAYHACDGKTAAGDAATFLGGKVFAATSVRDKVSDSMRSKSCSDRYYDINITNSNTIEYRKGAGTINPERVTMLVEYFELLCKYACQAKWQNISEDDIHSFLLKKAKNQLLIQILQQ